MKKAFILLAALAAVAAVWFLIASPYVNAAVARMGRDLIALDPADEADYRRQGADLLTALSGYQGRLAEIKGRFGGAKVAATEDIFVYVAEAAGLDLISPPAFMQAVA